MQSQAPRRILFVVSSLSFGGAENQTVIDANLLHEKGHAVGVVAFAYGQLRARLHTAIPVTILPEGNYWQRAKVLKRLAKAGQYEVLHAVLFAAKIVCAFAGLQAGIPVVWHVHGHRFYDTWKSKGTLQLLARTPAVKEVTFVCNAIRNWHLAEGYYPKRKTSVLYNGLPAHEPNWQPLPKPEVFTMGFIGRMVELKRVEILLRGAKLLVDQQIPIKLVLVGDGPERQRWENLTDELGIRAITTFVGYDPNPAAWYPKLSAIALPSSEEALSLTLIEACKFALPALAFAVGGNPEIILHGETGFLAANEPEFHRLLQQMATNPAAFPQILPVSQAHFKANFTLEAHYQALLHLYDRITH